MTSSDELRYAEVVAVSEPLYETSAYYIQLGRSIGLSDADVPVYQLVNREHKIVEGESFSLTEAINTMAGRTVQLAEYEENLEEGFPTIEGPGGTVH